MAKRNPRVVEFTLSEEHARLIDERFGLDKDASKTSAVKAIISDAMDAANESKAASAVGGKVEEKVQEAESVDIARRNLNELCHVIGIKRDIKILLATLEMFIQKYMADHPERTYSSDFLATMDARWRSFVEYKRPEYMQKAGHNAP